MRRRALVADAGARGWPSTSARSTATCRSSLAYRSDAEVEGAADEAEVAAACGAGWSRGGRSTSAVASPGSARRPTTWRSGSAGALARRHASQGQLRSLVLALKLAELTNVEARLGDPPVLLLDDVPSELDPVRRALLFEVIARLDCQTLISVTERETIRSRPRATTGQDDQRPEGLRRARRSGGS